MIWLGKFLNFRKVVWLGERIKIKGFILRARFGQVKGSVLRIIRIKELHLPPIFMALLLFISLKVFDINMSFNDRFLNFFINISMLFTWYFLTLNPYISPQVVLLWCLLECLSCYWGVPTKLIHTNDVKHMKIMIISLPLVFINCILYPRPKNIKTIENLVNS